MRRAIFAFASLLLLVPAAACGGSEDDTEAGNVGSSGASGAGAGKSGAAGSAGGTSGSGGAKAGSAGASAGTAGTSAGTAGASGTGGATAGGAGQSGTAGASAGTSGAAGASAGTAGAGGGAGTGGAPGCTKGSCPAGEACVSGACVKDCRLPGATPCASPTVCDVGDAHPGQCRAKTDGCVITGQTVSCAGGDQCGPGTTCGPSGKCLADLPCKTLNCQDGQCWGSDCYCERPKGFCTPAPVGMPGEAGTLNDPKFTRMGANGNEGAFDLDFDPQCNAWAVTMISGPDYLRKITPQGVVTSVTGVTNLNMGEVAVLSGKDGQFGGGMGDVALTYICCASCGCILSGPSGNPQGAAVYDAQTGMLPMKIPTATFTTGMGPFGNSSIDTGPYGLTWGLDRVLYLGNVAVNGDFTALDLAKGTSTPLSSFPKRVHASAPFDKDRLVVAIEGGDVYLVPVLGVAGSAVKITTLATHVTSILRDTWSGRIYAELGDKSIVSFAPDGTDQKTFATAPGKGRIALAGDGYLYHVTVFPTASEIVRFAMPTTWGM